MRRCKRRILQADGDTLERLVPDQIEAGEGEETLQLHLARYEFAAAHLRPGRVLDIACGVGYGTRLLADRSPPETTVLGVDLSPEAVAYARQRYHADRLDFLVADAMTFTDATGFDSIVSLETVEHLADPAGFLKRLVACLRPSGVLIASVPVTPSADANPHHLHDFTERSFRHLVEPYGLTPIACLRQVQPFRLAGVLHATGARMQHRRRGLLAFYLAHPGSLARRLWSTVRYGRTNHYLTIAWRAAPAR